MQNIKIIFTLLCSELEGYAALRSLTTKDDFNKGFIEGLEYAICKLRKIIDRIDWKEVSNEDKAN